MLNYLSNLLIRLRKALVLLCAWVVPKFRATISLAKKVLGGSFFLAKSLSWSFFDLFVRSVAVVFGVVVGVSVLTSSLVVVNRQPPRPVVEQMVVREGGQKCEQGGGEKWPVFAIIPITGLIDEEQHERLSFLLAHIEEKGGDSSPVSGLILDMDTPGGDAYSSHMMLSELLRFRDRTGVPICTRVKSLCASGGVLISSCSDLTVCTGPSLIGSVGVKGGTHFNVSSILDQLGVKTKTFFAGKRKDGLNPFRPWGEQEGDDIQEYLGNAYDLFLSEVVRGKPRVSESKLREVGAALFLSKKAQELGLVDEICDHPDDAFDLFAHHIGLDKKVRVVELRLSTQRGLGSSLNSSLSSLSKFLQAKVVSLFRPMVRVD